MKNLLKASRIRFFAMLLAVTLALPFSWQGFTGVYAWLSPFIMLNSVLALKSLLWLNLPGFIVLGFSLYRKRWFCRYLCPVGWGCDKVSRYSHRKGFSLSRIPAIGRWLALISLFAALAGFPVFIILDPVSMFNGFFSIFSGRLSLALFISFSVLPLLLASHLFFPGLWCSRLCPLGGLQDELSWIKKKAGGIRKKQAAPSLTSNPGRRFFIASGIGVLSGLTLTKLMHPGENKFFRPPGSVSSEKFNVLCTRCGSCIKACPTEIIIRHTGTVNLAGWMTPEVTFEKFGYCLESCNLCSRVCPSGAITLFDIKSKSLIKMGTALVHPENCLLMEFKECDRCMAACSYKAIDLAYYDGSGPMVPRVDKETCVGCGACAAICPPLTIEMLRI